MSLAPAPTLAPADRPSTLEETQPGRVAPIDRSLAPAVPLLAAFGALWLVVASLAGLAASLQLHLPGFLAGEPLLFGRLRAVEHTLLTYGWLTNAGLAFALWAAHRLGKVELRVGWAPVLGALGWNLALAAGALALLAGRGTGVAWLELPRAFGPFLVASFLAIALWVASAFSRRHTGHVFASQWYILAAILVFPVAHLVAHAMVLRWPSPGVVQAVVAAWHAQHLAALFLGSLALASLHLVIPKSLGAPLRAYYLAPVGFWTFLAFGTWSGTASLVGSPVPAWAQSVGVVGAALLFVPVLIISLTLLPTLAAGGPSGKGSPALRFATLGAIAFLLWGAATAALPFRSVSGLLRFTDAESAHAALGLQGFVGFSLLAGLYYLLPRMTGRAWPSAALVAAHYWASLLGLLGLVAVLAGHGWVQASAPALTPEALGQASLGWNAAASGFRALLLVGALAFLLNLVLLLLARPARRDIPNAPAR
jgi:cytochrome c oxidase cbb3-type subunit 1